MRNVFLGPTRTASMDLTLSLSKGEAHTRMTPREREHR
jgi:hypothetical protein